MTQHTKVKISKTVYNIVDFKDDEKHTYYGLKKANTTKSLIYSKKLDQWSLWSGRVGYPKQCKPEFLTDAEAEAQPKTQRRKSNVIRRNATKKITDIVKRATKVMCHCLESEFRGQEVEFTAEQVLEELKDTGTQFIACDDGTYKLRIHSNLWYRFDLTPRVEKYLVENRGCNTFTFSIEEDGKEKYVIVDQRTDLEGTCTEAFPEGYSDTKHRVLASKYHTDIQAINVVGSKMLQEWNWLTEETEVKKDAIATEEGEKPESNWYKEKQENKKLYYLDKARQAKQEASDRYKASNAAVKHIPFGQPILIGHHSEKRHRNALSRSHSNMSKSVEASKKAEYYEQKAAAVGNGGISSDDPDAIAKLETQLKDCQKLQVLMKAANKLVRKDDRQGLIELGYTEAAVNRLFEPDFMGRIGYPDYKLTNNNANIRRIKKRIEELQALSELETIEYGYDGLVILHNADINRVQLLFDEKPSKEMRSLLKSHGFRWSPKNTAWQRHLNNSGIWEANYVKNKFLEQNN